MSKRIWQHPQVPADEKTVSWRSVGQIEDTPAFRDWLEKEFPRGAAEMADGEDAELSRRSFMKLMGASTALAGFGMAACRRPEQYILPYANAPEWVIPGKATYYASSMPRAHGAVPLVVTTFEGRPTKLAPNTMHPDHAGTDAFTQASILDLYSPYRSRKILKRGVETARGDFEAVLAELAGDSSSRIGIVFGRDVSPTRSRLVKELRDKFSSAKFYGYEALEGEGMGISGDGVRVVADFSKADKIVSLDCDFVGLDPVGPVTPFFDRRKPEGKGYESEAKAAGMNRLYAVESAYSLTGGMADHRLRVKPSQLLTVAAEIAKAVGAGVSTGAVEKADDKVAAWVKAMIGDLEGGSSMILAGSRAPAAVHHLVAAINAKLGNLGDGKPLRAVQTEAGGLSGIVQLTEDLNAGVIDTVIFFTPSNPVYDAPADLDFRAALGKANVSIHFGLRTDHTALACDWHVPVTHYLENWADARSVTGAYTIVQPMIYPLYEGCLSENEVLEALLATALPTVGSEGNPDTPPPGYLAVRKTFEGLAGEGEGAWKKLLHDGFLADSTYDTVEATVDAGSVLAAIENAPQSGELEILFATDASVYDGRWIDNGWLQEAPDPISKISWDNAALIAPKTAKRLGIYDEVVGIEIARGGRGPDSEGDKRSGKLISLKVDGKELKLPVQIGFGQAENTIIVALGYGQGYNSDFPLIDDLGFDPSTARFVSLVGVNSGFNAYPLRGTKSLSFAALDSPPVLLGLTYPIAAVQEHHAMYGRALAREISTLPDARKGDFSSQLAGVKKQGMDSHAPPNISLYKPEDQQGEPLISDKVHQWGMAIDLSSCMGCNACLVACQAENNIPIVGKEQLAKGREMHWIRMDRYFAVQSEPDADGNDFHDDDHMEMIPQPVACMQCESAPCETVCPVNATVHTEDGLNAMAYNRCIGTRYCANNCPYKARRFNFFDYNKRNPLIPHNLYWGPLGEKQVGTARHLQQNPNVTVRMRGVMEKCTYCVQRLKDSKIRQRRIQRKVAFETGDSTAVVLDAAALRIPADSVKVACQEACPADAISFGNLLDDKDSKMVRAKKSERNYDLLQYIGTRPRTSYLARVKNPNPAMPGAKLIGKATIHMH